MKEKIRAFCLPDVTGKYLIRLLFVAVTAYVIFDFILLPFRIKGHSMEPTYKNGEFNFCLKPRYAFSEPRRYDVVCVKLAGEKVVLLKRIIALEGETVEIKKGEFYIDGRKIEEAYVKYPSDWNLGPRKVKKKHVYVVGDNRSVAMARHMFGQTPVERIIGTPLW